jgi:hypothetical protein
VREIHVPVSSIVDSQTDDVMWQFRWGNWLTKNDDEETDKRRRSSLSSTTTQYPVARTLGKAL